jgi:hypothetical protein
MTAFPVGMHMLSTGFSNAKCRCVIHLAIFHRKLSDFTLEFRLVFPLPMGIDSSYSWPSLKDFSPASLPVLPHGFIYKLTVSEDNRQSIEWPAASLQVRRVRQG